MLTDHDHRTRELLSEQVTDYAELSRWYAARGDSRRAALAAWASDVRALQALVWEGEVSVDTTPEEQLLPLSACVESAVLAAATTEVPPSLREAAEGARGALLGCLDLPVRELLASRLAGLEHLEDVAPPVAGAANEAVVERLDGRGGEQLVGDLLTASGDCRAVARVLGLVGDPEEAERQSAAADLAAFEAYLVLSSAASGDATLATTELRWDLAARRASHARPAPVRDVHDTSALTAADTAAPSSAVRAAMHATVVPAEEHALLAVLDRAVPLRSDA